MTTEKRIAEWVRALVAAQAEGAPLHGTQVSETLYGAVVSARCVQIGPVTKATPRPSPGGEEVEEFDAEVVLILLSRVGDARDDAAYSSARDDAVGMGLDIARAAFDDSTLGAAARDSMPDQLPRDFTTIAKTPYAVANLKLKFNPSGA